MTPVQQKREAAQLTANEVAARAKISPSKLSKIEHGKLKLKLADAVRLARVLGCKAEDLQREESLEPAEVTHV